MFTGSVPSFAEFDLSHFGEAGDWINPTTYSAIGLDAEVVRASITTKDGSVISENLHMVEQYTLDISQNQASIEDSDTPALRTCGGSRHDADVGKCECIRERIVIVPPHCQSTGRFVLDKNVALTISIPVRKMDTNSWAWHTEEACWAMLPVRWSVNVLVNFSGVTIFIDPLREQCVSACFQFH
jgi:hypothetical protein